MYTAHITAETETFKCFDGHFSAGLPVRTKFSSVHYPKLPCIETLHTNTGSPMVAIIGSIYLPLLHPVV